MRTCRQQSFCSTLGALSVHPATVGSLLLLIAVAGCSAGSTSTSNLTASSTTTLKRPVSPTTRPTVLAPPQDRRLEQSSPALDEPTSGPRKIRRATLLKVLKQGAQSFITHVRVRPAFYGKKATFWGWRILAYNGPGPIRVGDIVLRINNKVIEKPLQVMQVWETLGLSPTLTVEINRNGHPLTFNYLIED